MATEVATPGAGRRIFSRKRRRARYPPCMKVAEVIKQVQTLAPEHLAEPWDRVGLHVGAGDASVSRGMLCIDLTEAVLDEAIERQVDLLIAYHPPIFEPLTTVTDQSPRSRLILRAIQAHIALYSPHTALDAVTDGVNDWLAQGLGPGKITPIRQTQAAEACELVTFVPHDHAERLREALTQAGAGVIGHYRGCTFSVAGQGTFEGDETTHPTIGRPQHLERVKELRMEMIVPRAGLHQAVAALRQHHPYEEPAYYIFPLCMDDGTTREGQGRVVTLDRAISLPQLVDRIKKHLGAKHLEVGKPASRAGNTRIKRIGLCAGAGGSLLGEAGRIDAFFTGEMRHHDVLAAVSRGVAVILAGHTQTERPYLRPYRRRLEAIPALHEIEWILSRTDRAPTSVI